MKEKNYKEQEQDKQRGKKEELDSILKHFCYDENTGCFKFALPPSPNFKLKTWFKGTLKSNGYLYVYFKGKEYLAHRLAFTIYNKRWPVCVLDHIDGNRTNNKINNLREVSVSQNALNRFKSISNTGLLGVHFNKEKLKYQANLCVNGKKKHLGYFSSAEAAKEKYDREKQKIF